MTFADLPLPLILATSLPVVAMLVVACVGIWRAVRPRQRILNDPVLPAPIPLISALHQKEHPTTIFSSTHASGSDPA